MAGLVRGGRGPASAGLYLRPLAQEGAYSFQVEVQLAWWVHAPSEVVGRGLTDVPQELQRVLERPIWEISRGFGADQSDEAAAKIAMELGAQPARCRSA